jgi:hypothetical protein
MLHKIEMPEYKAQLEAILNFQRDLLEFACLNPPALPLTPAAFTSFGEQIGSWLTDRCWTDKAADKPTDFCKELTGLIAYITTHASEGPAIVDAFDNDRDFYRHVDDPDFELKYPDLAKDAQKAIQPLMVRFYTGILRRGFPDYIHAGAPGAFTYAKLLQEFYKANEKLSVCPGCDGPPPRLTDAMKPKQRKKESTSKRATCR